MIEQTNSILIDRPIGEVFAYVTDPGHISDWAPYVQNVRYEPDGPLGTGTRIWQTVRGREFYWQITAFEPDRLCIYRADYFYFTGQVTYRVEAVEGGTRFSVHDIGYRKGLMRLIEPILNRIDSKGRKEQMVTIKTILEQSPKVKDRARPDDIPAEAPSSGG